MDRRLAAILAADVVDYTRLMAEDQRRTLDALRQLRGESFEPVVRGHNGNVIKRMGDGWIVEFPSVSDAVACAIEIQERLTGNPVVRLRMGVHIGEVVFEAEDLFGDGINIAARLEALAKPGELLISDTVYHSLDTKTGTLFGGGSARQLKNVARPVAVWHWPRDNTAGTPVEPVEDAALPVGKEKPSIAVMSFDNMSTNPDYQFFADGIAEDIITALSKIVQMKVIARNSTLAYRDQNVDVRQIASDLGVRYVLQGSVRSGGNRLRITAQLIDANDSSPVWAERFDRTIDDIFDIQDEITKEIVTALQVNLTDGEVAFVVARGTNDIDAWQLCVRATELFMRFNTTDYLEARKYAEQAVAKDPGYAYAWATLGFTYWWDGRLGFTGDTDAKFARAHEFAEKAMALDDTVSWVIGLSTMVAAPLGRHDDGIALARRGVELYPGNADVRAFLGFAFLHAGQYQEAAHHIRAAMAINPFYPNWYRNGLSTALRTLGEFDEALVIANEVLETEPGNISVYLTRTYVFHIQSKTAETNQAIATIRRIAPGFGLRHIPGLLLINDPEKVGQFVDVLRDAGLPE